MAETSRTGRSWLRIALMASLALNILVVGFLAGSLLRDGHLRGDRRGGPDGGGFLYFRAFTEDQRQDLRRAIRSDMRDAEDETRDARRDQFFESYSRAADLLRQEPFDRDGFAAMLDAQVQRGAERRARGQAVLLDMLEGLSDAERRAYADRLDAAIDAIPSRQ